MALAADDLLARVVTPCSGVCQWPKYTHRRGQWLLQQRSKGVQVFPQPGQSMARRSTRPDPANGHAPRVRESELDLLRELPYAPAACKGRTRGPIHVSARHAPSSSENSSCTDGASTHVHHDDVAAQRGQERHDSPAASGTLPIRQLPRGAQPRSGATFVLVRLSSMKTREGSTRSWYLIHCAPRRATSGRSRSPATTHFCS